MDTAAAIREAADEMFCERGYSGVSARDIALRAGVNKALVFYHFKSMEALFEEVLEGYYQAHRAALAEAFETEGSLRERFHRMLDAYLEFMAHNRRYAGLIQQQVADPRTHALIERNLAPLFRWIQEILGEVVPSAGPTAGRQFFVTFSGAVINYFTYAPLLAGFWGEDPMSADALAERRAHVHWLADTVLDAIEGEAHP